MDVLDGNTLLEAIDTCDKYKDVNICIVFKNLRSADEFINAIISEIKGNRLSGWKFNRWDRGYAVLKSKNDSFIDLINVYNIELLKSHSFDWVLIEKGVSEEYLQFDAPIEYLPPLYGTEESEELDNFLNSFKIV